MKTRTIKIGDHVICADVYGTKHDGLVTAVWGKEETKDGDAGPCINVLFVTKEPDKRDQYGAQIERDLTSCSHKLSTEAPGRFWHWPDETF